MYYPFDLLRFIATFKTNLIDQSLARYTCRQNLWAYLVDGQTILVAQLGGMNLSKSVYTYTYLPLRIVSLWPETRRILSSLTIAAIKRSRSCRISLHTYYLVWYTLYFLYNELLYLLISPFTIYFLHCKHSYLTWK